MTITETATLRVIRITRTTFGTNTETSTATLWQGSDVVELSKQYPPSNVFGADQLGHTEIEGGCIRIDHEFQQFTGEWQTISDPRRRLTPVSDYERAIDAENRRRFPGDFDSEVGCDNCGDGGCEYCLTPAQLDDVDDEPEEYHACTDPACLVCTPSPKYNCIHCLDFGCHACHPDYFQAETCLGCGHSFLARQLDRGRCLDCSYEFDLHCHRCCNSVHSDLANHVLCGQCQSDLAYSEDDFGPDPKNLLAKLVNFLKRRRKA